MVRLMMVAAVVALAVLGCSSTLPPEVLERQVYQLSRVPEAHRWTFRKVNVLVAQGEYYDGIARTYTRPNRKTELLQKAAYNFREAILVMREILDDTERQGQRDYIIHCIQDTEVRLEEVVKAMPLEGE